MRKASLTVALLIILGVVLSACSAPPPLKSDKYLNDTSLISGDPCAPPCFQGITVGQTTFTDAIAKVKANTALFSNVQSQDKPPQAQWSTKDGELCCQVSANADSGLVDVILIRVKPGMTVKQVIEKYGTPKYVTAVDYTPDEAALTLIFPDKGLVTWVVPGNADSAIAEGSPIVAVLYVSPTELAKQIEMASLQGWDGYKPYKTYKGATPVVTPKVTPTPGQ